MLHITQLRLRPGEEKDLESAASKYLKIPKQDVLAVKLLRLSVDARKRDDVRYVLSLAVSVKNEKAVLAKNKNRSVSVYQKTEQRLNAEKSVCPALRPVVVGAGPAGLFAAMQLALAGAKPILLERGKDVDRRSADVELMSQKGILDPESNVQFGEGGAGTFSDGKLHTGIKDSRLGAVLQLLVDAGAPEEILWRSEPHVGTDMLKIAVKGLRQKLIALGCEVRFENKLTDIVIENGAVKAVRAVSPTGEYELECSSLILAPGQSAEDIYTLLYRKGVKMHKKPFSVGVRIEHLQKELDLERYGDFVKFSLPHSSYKLVEHLDSGRSVYTFCVCPGGEVISASNEEGCVVTNGMSAFARDMDNIAGALLVTVTPDDLPDHPLAGLAFRREIEQKAWRAGGGGFIAPAQTVGDFLAGKTGSGFGKVKP
ncbi:MAG: NAD(P)/FAD-dependent oxidoreductase, partial [Oscillospiraceae bacterium]|nr:NAD(P)/FAD-dependent oxidoreductase [Oscillospiraceae bacterium]